MYIILIYEELTYWKRPWCWEGLGAGGEGDDRGWDGWIVSPTRWTWVWVNSRCWWWTGRPGVLRFMRSKRVGHDWVTELNWTELNIIYCVWVLSHFSYVWLCAALWTLACQVPLCMGFSRQEYWSGLLCPPPGDLPDPGTEPTSLMSPALIGRWVLYH